VDRPRPRVSVALAHAGPTAGFSVAIPATPSLAGFVLGMQALAIDAASANGTALTNGLIAQVR